MEISVGIQWLLQPARYFSQAHLYFSGSSWFTSARQLIIALSSTRTRAPPRSMTSVTVLVEATAGSGETEGCAETGTTEGSVDSTRTEVTTGTLAATADEVGVVGVFQSSKVLMCGLQQCNRCDASLSCEP